MATARHYRGALFLLPLFIGSCSPSEQGTDTGPPKHVVLIVVDTLRADHLSTYGYELPTSPHLDQLAEDGVRFERAFSQSSWTVPSMVSMMTGCYLKGPRVSLPNNVPVIAELFHDAGYTTGAFIHNPIINSTNGFERGFDTFESPKASGHNNPTKGYPVVEPAAEWIATHAEESTFTYVHYSDPHSPYGPQSEERQNWMKDPPALSTQLEDHLRAYTAHPDEKIGQLKHGLEMIRVSIAGYNDDVFQSDLRIGQIIATLKEHDLFEEAVIIVTSDHGEGLWTREDSWDSADRRTRRATGQPISLYNLMKKGHGNHLNSEQIHIPLILKAPGVQQTTVNSAVEGVDLFPTLLELCDLPRPASLQGRSLLDAIRDDASWDESRPFAFSTTRYASTALTQDGWHLLLPNQWGECAKSMIPELYHLPSDPWERNNLASEQPALMSELTSYISARIEMGLAREESDKIAAFITNNQDALLAFGYIDDGIVDTAVSALHLRTIDSMLDYYTDSACVLRLEFAKELAKRKLNEEQLERVRSFLPEEESQAVYDVLRSIL